MVGELRKIWKKIFVGN